MHHETWKNIPGYEDLYRVSDQGRVYSVRNGIILRSRCNKHRYLRVDLYTRDGKRKSRLIHRLVALAFLGKPPDQGSVVNHLNFDRQDNRPENLEWCSVQENNRHAYIHGKTDFHRSRRYDNTFGTAGVTPHGNGYEIYLCGRYLGWRKKLEDAVAVRKAEERRMAS